MFKIAKSQPPWNVWLMAHFTSATLFPPVHGGCYIISSVGDGYSCGMSVM